MYGLSWFTGTEFFLCHIPYFESDSANLYHITLGEPMSLYRLIGIVRLLNNFPEHALRSLQPVGIATIRCFASYLETLVSTLFNVHIIDHIKLID